MPTHVFDPPKGRIERLRIDSTALAANLLGDPSTRTVDVYLPPGYDDASTAYPLFVALAGFTGSGLKMHAWQGFGENVPQRVDRLVASGERARKGKLSRWQVSGLRCSSPAVEWS